MVRDWMFNLIIDKTYTGMYLRRIITEKLTDELGNRFSLPSKEEEAKGIDGRIDGHPITIKPHTSKKSNASRSDTTNAYTIVYKRKERMVELYIPELPT